MENNQFEQDFENKHLEQTISIAQEQLSSLTQSSQENKEAILSSKKEMREDTTHSISNLWSLENFYELIELNQYANPLSDKISEYEMEVNKILSLERTINSPYFARIDFKFDDEDEFEKIYIGLSSLIDDESYEMYVYDWRSPIASVFYRFGTGKAFYEAPARKIKGEVNLKRQYEINKGKLEYFFDADIQIKDEFLRKLLSQNASSKMKTIVETIQKDQDIIIRDMEMDLMMVQGVAGSGKTSVALHRVAYLMYQGLSAKLSSNNIVILSPNTLFEQYISNVLPELGEKNVNSVIFEDILVRVLQNDHIQTKNQLLERLLTSNSNKYSNLIKSNMDFKGSSQFVEILKRYIRDLPNRWIEFSDVYYNGKHIASRQLLKGKILDENKIAHLGSRLKELEYSILKPVHDQRKNRLNKLKDFVMNHTMHSFEVEEVARMLSIYESTVLMKEIKKFTQLDCLKFYKKLFSNKNYFYSLAKGLELPDSIEDIISFTCENLDLDNLQYDDALALCFLHLSIKDYTDTAYEDIKQVVIDEAQDYYPMHFEILNLLFPKSRYTVLGDINQTIGKQEDLSLYDHFSRILNKRNSTLITMDKSFRCTSETLEYSAKFLDQGFKINSFSRKGDTPVVYTAQNSSALDDMVISEIASCKEKGYQSIGLICKTEKDAISLHDRLKNKLNIQLIKSDGTTDLIGIFIIPVYLSKGLEFDGVLIFDADNDHFNTADDKKLLYIACTRALHRLSLFYTGIISPLL
ncbi:MAG: helicase [Clostridiales bacterium GWB2_37_7]|nr:MAG: helicase [Clostridiales bacterium GWB2_37_7]